MSNNSADNLPAPDRGDQDADFNRYLDEFDFELPEELIATHPAPRRDHSRLLVLNRADGTLSDHHFYDLPRLLSPTDRLIFNNTKVSRKRVTLRRATGARLATLFLEEVEPGVWSALIRGSGKLKPDELLFPEDPEITDLGFRYRSESDQADSLESMRFLEPVHPESGEPAWPGGGENAENFFNHQGAAPLPPYMKRSATPTDTERYQTVYARQPGSVAAPTAGFHFTPELIETLKHQGVSISELELTVGYGTFAPLGASNFMTGALHREFYRMGAETARDLNTTGRPGRNIAVGTTSLRAMESNYRENKNHFKSGDFETRLFIKPPDRVRSIQGLITNFHLPRSSLFLLVCAFAPPELVMRAYKHAIQNQYRFYSYGDAMLLL